MAPIAKPCWPDCSASEACCAGPHVLSKARRTVLPKRFWDCYAAVMRPEHPSYSISSLQFFIVQLRRYRSQEIPYMPLVFRARQPRSFALRLLLPLVVLCLPAWAAEKVRFHADDYQIDAVLNPHDHKLVARAKVKITALEDLNIATFQLHNDLRLTRVSDATGKPLTADRNPQDSSVRVSLKNMVAKDQSTTLDFEYEGVLDSADDSPVPGLKLTSINDDTSYLLYAGDWFPVNAFGIDRFTATINLTVPAHMIVIGSGAVTPGTASALKGATAGAGPAKTFSLKYDKASFPGTIIAGDFGDYASTEGGVDLHVYFKPTHKDLAAAYA